MNIEPVHRVLRAIGAAHALIDAYAMAVRGYPRFTIDVDLLTADDCVLDPAAWAALEREGAAVGPRRGDADDPLGGVVHILLADGRTAIVLNDGDGTVTVIDLVSKSVTKTFKAGVRVETASYF